MPLSNGARVGSYEVIGPLGAGGMGEVYRARDAKLHREVAIKVLPDLFATDPERVGRLEREAHALAALNHPRIAQIYGVIESPPALVMELVDGEDLSARVARGPIPTSEALPLAAQIAEALECAHERGIIHRDLKPGNIKVSESGAVKVLDFGLAKAIAPDSPLSDNSPTFTSPMTQLGVILGTAAYMAPEQAKGRAADRRADVWAFGAVLFEMLSGRRAFQGEDVTDVIASIMRAEPEWTALPRDTPLAVHRLLRRCLQKDRAKRLDSMAVARLDIEEAINAPRAAAAFAEPTRRTSWLTMVACGAVCAATAAAVTWLVMRPADVAPMVVRAQVSPTPPEQLSIDFFVGDLGMSGDGSSVAYAAGRNGAVPEIFVRRLDQDHAVALPGTRDGRTPIFSADGQWVLFQLGTNLVKVPVSGGAQQTVCLGCAGGYRGGTWLPDGSFVYSTGGGQSGLRLVRPDAPSFEALTTIDRTGNERAHTFPHALPNGRGILFAIDNLAGDRQIAVIDLQSKKVKVVARGGSSPQYSPGGHLLYAASGTLYAVPFDLDRLESTGPATPVVNGLVTKSSGAADYTVAANGTIMYVSGDPVVSTYAVTVRDSSNALQALALPPGGYVIVRFSPDGTQAVVDSRSNDMDLWVWSFARKLARRLTFSPRQDQYPVWTPDGRHILYAGLDGTKPAIFRQAADGSGTPERIVTLETMFYPTALTPDGATLLAHLLPSDPSRVAGIFTIAMTGDHTPHLLEHTARNAMNAQVSPDGRWIAYQTIESGRSEVLIHPFPNLAGGRWQISTEGGSQPLFNSTGTQLFYRDPERRLMSVPLQFSPQFSPGNPTVVMENVFSPGPGRPYDVAKDGRIMLVNESRTEQSASRAPQLNMVLNFTQELKRLVATTR